MNPLEWLADHALNGLIHAFNWTSDHMSASGALYTAGGLGYVVARLVRGYWPNPAHRPRWARAVLTVCAPVDAAVTGVLGRKAPEPQPRKKHPLRRSGEGY